MSARGVLVHDVLNCERGERERGRSERLVEREDHGEIRKPKFVVACLQSEGNPVQIFPKEEGGMREEVLNSELSSA